MTNESKIDLIKLRAQLVRSFTREEIKILCSDLGIPFDNLPGSALESLALELVNYCDRRASLPDLIRRCSELRPRIDWNITRTSQVNGEKNNNGAGHNEPLPVKGKDHGLSIPVWVYITAAVVVIAVIAIVIVLNKGNDTPIVPTPKAPTNLSLKNGILTWEDNSDNETGFQIERSASNDFKPKESATVDKNITSFDISGLKASYNYNTVLYYRVFAYNTSGNSAQSNIISNINLKNPLTFKPEIVPSISP